MKSFFNWSGGKDSALALYHAQKNNEYSIEKLLTNINGAHRRISMHGVREDLLELQARAISLPLQKIILPEEPSMHEYENKMKETVEELSNQKFTHAFFGDIFLEDLKTYREQQLSMVGIECVFPLWKIKTTTLINEFLELGFKTIVVCVNEEFLDKSFCGRIIDKDFLQELPENVDACGENGEFHTFVFNGPTFQHPVEFTKGEIVYRKYKAPKQQSDNCFQPASENNYGFYFCDLLPA
jgi:uncharacterized protein (TIGR00290 family)